MLAVKEVGNEVSPAMAYPDVSVSTRMGSEGSNRRKIGAVVNFSASCVQMKGPPFSFLAAFLSEP